jgi:CRISPR-associated protein Cmr5
MSTERMKLEQGRAAFAFQKALKGKDIGKEYLSSVRKLPMLIKNNGLGAAIAFAFAKGSKNGIPDEKHPWGLIYHQIEEWLKKDEKKLIIFDDNQLVYRITEEGSTVYRTVTIEVLALLSWMKRFAEGLIDD